MMKLSRSLTEVIVSLLLLGPVAAHADMWPDEPGMYPNRDYVHQQFAEHIDPFSGNLQLHLVDGFVPGNGGFDLKIRRSYNALSASVPNSPFGGGWDIHFGRVQGSSTSCNSGGMSLQLPDGSAQTLYFSNGVAGTVANQDYISLNFWKATCDGSGTLTVWSPDGTRYDMTELDGTTRHVKRMTDRNGNYADFSYTLLPAWGHKVVTAVSTSDGHNATFTHSGGFLSTITVQGRSWSYTVVSGTGGATTLTRVQPPAGSAWTFTYNTGTSLIASVQTPQGGVTNYTYTQVNFMPGIVGATSQSAVASKSNSLGVWNFSYTPSTSAGTNDVTTVTLPSGLGTITYRHFGLNTVNAGEVWKIGSLYQKVTGNDQTETFSWTPQTISNAAQTRPGYFKTDTTTNRALLASRSVARDNATFTTTYGNFDSFGNPQTITETGSQTRQRTLTYFTSAASWITNFPDDETISGVGSISRQRDFKGNLTSESRFGVTTTYSYDSSGDVSSKTNARQFSTTYGGYAFGVPQTESRPQAVTITRFTDNFGNVTSETDGVSTWGYAYDGINRIVAVDHPIGSDATIAWTDTSRSLTRGAYSETSQFDSFGRMSSINRAGVTQTFQYDALGRKTFESLPGLSSSGSTFTLDLLGRVKSVTSPAGTRTITYGASSVTVMNERNFATTYAYNTFGDPDDRFLTNISSGDGTSVSMTRDQIGTLLSATQASITRTYSHDSRLFLTSISEPEVGMTTFGRDAAGNMTSKTVGGVVTTYGYDGLNRVSTIANSDASGTIAFTYDGRSKIVRVTNPTATRDYLYDANGNLKQDKLSVDGSIFTADYAYDLIDGLSSISYPLTKGTVLFAPDNRGRPTQASPYLTGVAYRASGNLSSITYGNGVVTSFDPRSPPPPANTRGIFRLRPRSTGSAPGSGSARAGHGPRWCIRCRTPTFLRSSRAGSKPGARHEA